MISGAFTLLITPFDKNMNVDIEGLRILVRRQVDSGIHGIAPMGVTGETPALADQEIKRIVETVVEETAGKCKVAPDTCSNNLEQTISRVKLYQEIGCDYVVVFAPFLVHPSQEGVVEFYRRIAENSKIPIIVHNAPARVGINIEPETYSKLAEIENIIGTKDGNKAMDHLAKIIHLTQEQEFSVYTGKDTTAFPLMSFGGSGVFTVAGNVVPEVMKRLADHCLSGDFKKAEEIHHRYFELFEALRFETNPMAAKEALGMMDLPGGGLRLPLTRLSKQKRDILEGILSEEKLY